MNKRLIILLLMLNLAIGRSFAQLPEIDQWWVTFGIGNAFQGFSNNLKGVNMFGDINIHAGNYYYQLGLDDSGTPARSDKTMGVVHFDLGQTIINDYYMVNGFYGLGIMNYSYADPQQKQHNVTTIGINLNAQLIVKPFDLFGLGIVPYTDLRWHHSITGLRICIMLGDGI
jgi:hypothetical protein